MSAGAAGMAGPAVPRGWAPFGQGFRPFFLIAGVWALLAIPGWIAALHGAALPDGPLPLPRWHAHEMLAGFIGAALGGFLLTAVPNWTGRPGYSGPPLALLAALFVAARLALLPGSPLPVGVAAAVALIPLPALLATVLPAVAAARKARLLGPPALVLAFWAGDLMMLGDAAGWLPGAFSRGQALCLDVALVLVGLIGGRIVPSFTMNALRKAGEEAELRPIPGVDRAAVLSLLAVVVADQALPGSAAAGVAAGAAALFTLLRLSRWHGLRTLGQPILWVLHLAYLVLPVSLAVKAASLLAGPDWAAGWMHLQSIGAIALMILAVMTRATLGHTGRALVAAPPVVLAYLLLLGAALARGFGPALWPGMGAYALAGALWAASFGLFLAVYAPMLLRTRPDGKPG
ncbi:NnrS family protein [Muricoccus pecuniae]|uniref:Uncharacterized protein involved in response to NO n=1 Tax=Muricoccus pecuniae TaxID=693023 RepID=A0A840Y634_9PROT|nr:NnrS family protein [Roseomonas pecuniae]MBB5695290.1 uncharacterized protein involved in response to NO [Roseomonas pecuniae]